MLKYLLPLCLAVLPTRGQTPTAAEVPVALRPASTQMVAGAPQAEAGAFSIVILPDTQFYAQLHPEIFHKQVNWIAANAGKYNIKFTIQVGDVTETAAEAEWLVAKDCFAALSAKVPFASAPGNHDYGGRLQIFSRRSPFSLYLPLESFRQMQTFGGVYDKEPAKSENQWHAFEAGGRKWLVIGLEFAPRADVLRWAGEVVAAHPDHSVILFTHAYLDPKTGNRINLSASVGLTKGKGKAKGPPPPDNPDITHGEDLWQRVASKYPNVAMVLSGHACYTNHRSSPGAAGQPVEEVVVDYQKDVNGGNGWLRLLQFLPDGKTVRCQDYSPTLDQKCVMPDRTYDFTLPPPAGG